MGEDEEEHLRLNDGEIEKRLTYLDDLLARVEAMPGPEGQIAGDALAALTQIYGEALARVLSAAGCEAVAAAADDPLVGHLMLLHGLHPSPPEQRVEQAILEMQELLGNRSAVQLSGIESGVARLSVTAGGCGSEGLSSSVRDIVLGAAPDLVAVETVESAPGAHAFIPVDSLRRRPSQQKPSQQKPTQQSSGT